MLTSVAHSRSGSVYKVFTTRSALVGDVPAILDLMPRLADYELPDRRTPEMFWVDDAGLVQLWADGSAPHAHLRVGVDDDQRVLGFAMITLGRDKFSGVPCAHLEVVVVDPIVDGTGLGRQLITDIQADARSMGAEIMSLHVMRNNRRARHVYQQLGFDEEMIRSVAFLD